MDGKISAILELSGECDMGEGGGVLRNIPTAYELVNIEIRL